MLVKRAFYPLASQRGALFEMDRLRREMDRVMNAVTGDYSSFAGVFPPVNVWERTNDIVVAAEAPGIAAEDVKLSVFGKTLAMEGERKAPELPQEARFHRRERQFFKFSRVVGLPAEVDVEKVTARVKNGVLTVTLPKAEAAKPKSIAVSAE